MADLNIYRCTLCGKDKASVSQETFCQKSFLTDYIRPGRTPWHNPTRIKCYCIGRVELVAVQKRLGGGISDAL